MDNIETKSTFNLKAADYLLKDEGNNFFCSSVHCSYYATYQYMMYFLKEKCNKDYICQRNECQGKDSHIYITEQVVQHIKEDVMADVLSRNIGKLKALRKKSDYSNITVSIYEAKRAFRLSQSIINQLKQQ